MFISYLILINDVFSAGVNKCDFKPFPGVASYGIESSKGLLILGHVWDRIPFLPWIL